MGGFEVMNELLPLTGEASFAATWLDLARRYKQMALEVRHNNFPVRRLEAYAAWHDRDAARMASTWQALWRLGDHGLRLPDASTHLTPPEVPMPMDELPGLSTNNAALWSLDAIYMLEVINP